MYSEIVFPQDSTGVSGEAIGTSGATGLFTGTTAKMPVIPGTLALSDGTTTTTDDGNGGILKAGTKVGTINYITGAVNVTTVGAFADTHAITAAYKYFTSIYEGAVIVSPGQYLPNSPKPLAMLLRNDGAANDYIIQQSADGTNFVTVKSGSIAAWAQVDVGIVDMLYLKVFASASARLQGQIVSAT